MASPEHCDRCRLDELLHERLPAHSQRALEAHLLECPCCREQLDELAGGAPWWTEVRRHLGGDGAAALSRTAAPERPTLDLDFLQPSGKPGSLGRLGPYEILEILGRGGMGVVLKAFDPALHRPVAIKVLAAEFAARGASRKRFAREARAAAAVVHEHVVPVHAVDADATPPYLVMAFIPGESLQERIDRTGPLELREVLRIGMQTAAGLAAAHAQGLVHRDIKPANIMLENGIERVRITDFGLARAVDDASVTQSGSLAGTPQYMAPEQADGAAVDQRADLFALGSTLYAMCTALPPFRGSSSGAVLRQVCEAQPQPVHEINPDIPAWLEGIIGKLHAKDPAQRFASAAEVADLLERCLAHVQQPHRNPLPARAAELARYVPRRRPQRYAAWWRQVAALIALTGLAGLALVLVQPAPTTPPGTEPITVPQNRTIMLDTDGDLRWQDDDVRARLAALRQSLAAPLAGQPADGWGLEPLRQRAETLRHSFSAGNLPAIDPVDVELQRIRGRLDQLRQSFGTVPE